MFHMLHKLLRENLFNFYYQSENSCYKKYHWGCVNWKIQFKIHVIKTDISHLNYFSNHGDKNLRSVKYGSYVHTYVCNNIHMNNTVIIIARLVLRALNPNSPAKVIKSFFHRFITVWVLFKY